MPTAPISQQPGRNRWWSRDQRAERDRRIEQIQHINDPGTSRDEVLTWTRRILSLLLAFTGGIAVFSYYKFFGQNIPPIAAGTAAILLAVVIEFGKNYLATKAIREPFFSGWSNIFSSVAETIYFLGVASIAAICFYVSVVNSTIGASQLSRLLSYQRNETNFTPNTADIDAQIHDARTAQQRNADIKWKGIVTYQAQKAIQSDGKAIEALQRQREKTIADQRADFERHQAQITSQTDHTAGLVLQVGGWVELLQALLIFLRVSCERILVDRQMDRERRRDPSSPTEPLQSTGPFSFNGAKSYSTENSAQPTFFNRGRDGNVIPSVVSQQPLVVTQQNAAVPNISPDEILRWFETELRREPSHFSRTRGVNMDTVIARIHNKLRRAHAAIDRTQPGAFSMGAAGRFARYLRDNLIPILEEQKSPYDGMPDLLASLQHKTEQEAVII